LESKPWIVLFQELIALPWDVFGPVDFCAFLRLAAILCGEDPLVGIAELGGDSMVTAAGMSDSARLDSDRVSFDSDSGGNPLSGWASSTIQTSGRRQWLLFSFCACRDYMILQLLLLQFKQANSLVSLRL
jgi:hypothetical protein